MSPFAAFIAIVLSIWGLLLLLSYCWDEVMDYKRNEHINNTKDNE